MERVSKSLSQQYIGLKLFLDHLEAIEAVLKPVSSEYKLVIDRYKFDSVSEIPASFVGKIITELEITLRNPSIMISIGRDWAFVGCYSDDALSSGLFYQLDKILSSAERIPRLAYRALPAILIMLVMVVIYALTIGVSKLILVILLILHTFFSAYFLCVVYILIWRRGVVILNHRHHAKSFFRRNSDRLAVATIVGIVVSVVTYLVTSYGIQVWTFLQSIIR
jgi:hypothetical protein